MPHPSKARTPKTPKRSEISPGELEHFDAVVQRFGGEPGTNNFAFPMLFGFLMVSPPLCTIASRMGTFVRAVGDTGSSYTHRDREFVD